MLETRATNTDKKRNGILEQWRGANRFFLKVHDSTTIGKLARFPVPGMIYLVLNGL